ncbi:hypothetical protein GALL_164040 [mine drainage metagenome]|uniref:Uncharacterized protein n=1 Tax=mine drainage metagenome TaxID=410659 RepID=A0A1J5RZZ5_9ZZZZ
MRVTKDHTLAGSFWLPGKENDQCGGTLRIVDGGRIHLELIGFFEGRNQFTSTSIPMPRVIGYVEEIGPVTIDGCGYSDWRHSTGSASKTVLRGTLVYCGVELSESEPLTIESLSFGIEGLDQWHHLSGIRVAHDFKKKSATVTYLPQRNVLLWAADGFTLELTFAWSLPWGCEGRKATISERSRFRLSSDRPRPLDDFIIVAHQLVTMLCIATSETVAIVDVIGSLPAPPVNGDSSEEPEQQQCAIYYESIPFSKTVPKIEHHNILFRYRDIETRSQDAFQKWFDAYKRITPALTLYLGAVAGDHKYLDGRFLALAQALESYHRRSFTETLMSQVEFDSLKTEIIAHCPPIHRELVEGRLRHGNEPSLATRLKRLVEPFKKYFAAEKKFIRAVVDRRNYQTHFDPSLEVELESGMHIWTLCKRMEALLRLHFLREIGMDDATITTITKQCDGLIRQLNEEL